MARQFSWPAIQLLEVGQCCGVFARPAEVRRKVGPYATRANKRFKVEPMGDTTLVTREPVTDSELPGA